jgi:hypothetical protein
VTNINADADLGRACMVIWVDSGAQVSMGWSHAADLDHQMRVSTVETVGFWVGENEDVLALAQSKDDDSGYLNVQVILKSCVTRKEWLS